MKDADVLKRLVARLVPGGALVIGAQESLPGHEMDLAPRPGTRWILLCSPEGDSG